MADRWLVQHELGSGGHATVYRAEHADLGHAAAIKVLHLERCGSAMDEMLARFKREARLAARIHHRNVIRVFDYGELDDGAPYFVMELIEGDDLQTSLDRGGPLPIPAAMDVALQVLAGLGALHEHGVVHRDIKPSNVMLRERERGGVVAKLVDLGIASCAEEEIDRRFTVEGTVLGTPEYMSPEQIRGLPLDARADLYSVGVLFFEMLTGKLPFRGKGPCSTLALALTQDAPTPRSHRPEIPEAIERVIMKALSKNAEERYQTALEMAAALSEAARALAIPRSSQAWTEHRRVMNDASEPVIELRRAVAPSGPPNDRGERYSERDDSDRKALARRAAPEPAVLPSPAPRDRHGPRSGARPKKRVAARRKSVRPHKKAAARQGPKQPSPGRARLIWAVLGIGVATALGFGMIEPEHFERFSEATVRAMAFPR